MKTDISLWDYKARMRKMIRSLATTVMSLGAVNTFYSISNKSYFIAIINIISMATMLPLFISFTKWEKNPPAITDEIIK